MNIAVYKKHSSLEPFFALDTLLYVLIEELVTYVFWKIRHIGYDSFKMNAVKTRATRDNGPAAPVATDVERESISYVVKARVIVQMQPVGPVA